MSGEQTLNNSDLISLPLGESASTERKPSPVGEGGPLAVGVVDTIRYALSNLRSKQPPPWLRLPPPRWRGRRGERPILYRF